MENFKKAFKLFCVIFIILNKSIKEFIILNNLNSFSKDNFMNNIKLINCMRVVKYNLFIIKYNY